MFKCELLSGHGTKVVSVLAVLHMPESLCNFVALDSNFNYDYKGFTYIKAECCCDALLGHFA
jgi:hypothetical protein